jgi:hypothetical protein
MKHGWSVKHLQRRLALSATYAQASKASPALLQRDPKNELLARGPRFRVEAEAVRDVLLAASGLLNRQLGGPPCYPPLPAFMLQPPVSYGPKVWKEDTGPNRYRRALYTHRYRSIPYPALETFDAPNGDAACVRRPRSNTPLQALMTLNEPVFVECAQALAAKTLAEGGADDAGRIGFVFQRCTGRAPTAEEFQVLSGTLAAERKRFAQGDQAKLVAGAKFFPAGKFPIPEAAAWTVLARVALNLDETITKE